MRSMFLGLFAVALVMADPVTTRGQQDVSTRPAATVNGRVIPEIAVQRALRRVPAAEQAQARKEILDYLIDLVLLDQYVIQQGFTVPDAEVQAKLREVKEELSQNGRDLDALLKTLMLTEEELKENIAASLRWEKYLASKATDQRLVEFFVVRKDWFDGSQVRARHILVAVEEGADAATRQAARNKIETLKKQIESRIAERVAKLPPQLDPLQRAEERLAIATEVFAEAARESDCPSKRYGGDLGLFPRLGFMVEPFAKAAFALQPGEMVGPVETQFGYHLILCTGREPGDKELDFAKIKPSIREVYSQTLKRDLAQHLRKSAKIEIHPPPAKP